MKGSAQTDMQTEGTPVQPEAALEEATPGGGGTSPRLRRLQRLAPWVSLVVSVVGAVWMERDHQAAALVAGAVAVTSLVMSALLWLRRRQGTTPPAGIFRVMSLAGVVATQSLAQLPLFFSAPFYALAFAYTPLQVLFALAFVLAVVAVSWDPLAYRLLPDRRLGAPLSAFCSFVGLRAALPMLGVPAVWALVLSLAVLAVLTFWDLLLRWPGVSLARRLGATSLLVLGLLALAPSMPAAPLRLVHAGIGTGVQARELQGEGERFTMGTRLVCFTAVFSPRETEALLVHRWTRDGEWLADLELPVRGGRQGGFRTWSRLHAGRPGVYRCEVRNPLGQVLGRLRAEVH